MQTEQMRQRPPRESVKTADLNVKLSSDELAAVLGEASRLQGLEQRESREVATIEEALATAQDLGIDRQHVYSALEDLRRQKVRRARFRAATRRRRDAFLKYLGTMLMVFGIVFLSGGWNAAVAVFTAMSIALFIFATKWGKAAFADRLDQRDPTSTLPGECRVCGKAAWNSTATFCEEHRGV